jgi:hypothetical protein
MHAETEHDGAVAAASLFAIGHRLLKGDGGDGA